MEICVSNRNAAYVLCVYDLDYIIKGTSTSILHTFRFISNSSSENKSEVMLTKHKLKT